MESFLYWSVRMIADMELELMSNSEKRSVESGGCSIETTHGLEIFGSFVVVAVLRRGEGRDCNRVVEETPSIVGLGQAVQGFIVMVKLMATDVRAWKCLVGKLLVGRPCADCL